MNFLLNRSFAVVCCSLGSASFSVNFPVINVKQSAAFLIFLAQGWQTLSDFPGSWTSFTPTMNKVSANTQPAHSFLPEGKNVTRVPQHHNSTSKTLYLVAQLIHDFTTFLERSSLVYNYPGCHALPLHLMALHFRLNCLLTYFPSKESVVPDTCT